MRKVSMDFASRIRMTICRLSQWVSAFVIVVTTPINFLGHEIKRIYDKGSLACIRLQRGSRVCRSSPLSVTVLLVLCTGRQCELREGSGTRYFSAEFEEFCCFCMRPCDMIAYKIRKSQNSAFVDNFFRKNTHRTMKSGI